MSCEKDHSIEIKNLDKKNFSREIVLISGCVKNQCEHDSIELLKCGKEESQKTNRSFKFLLKLDTNRVNDFKIRYCQKEIDLSLEHKPIDPIFYDVQPIYIIPKGHDGRFQSCDTDTRNTTEVALKKIDLLASLAQCVISSKLSPTADEKSFVLNKCEIFRSSMSVDEAWQMNQFEMFDRIAQEIIDRFGAAIVKRRKFVGFLSCTKFLGLRDGDQYNYANIKSRTLASPSLGCDFLALLGNGCFFALPNSVEEVVDAFRNKTVVDTRVLLDDSNYRRTYGGCFSTALGSLIHEIGHIFDLGHTESGLMGTDIDFVHKFFLCENFTEIMPKRSISNCQQSKNESTDKSQFSNRITKVNRNSSAYMEKYHEQKNNDMTFFERNCQLTLMSHRWFTQKTAKSELFFDEITATISSSSDSIALVEVRELESKNSLVRKYWDFARNDNTKVFTLDKSVLNSCILFAISYDGAVLKRKFQPA